VHFKIVTASRTRFKCDSCGAWTATSLPTGSYRTHITINRHPFHHFLPSGPTMSQGKPGTQGGEPTISSSYPSSRRLPNWQACFWSPSSVGTVTRSTMYYHSSIENSEFISLRVGESTVLWVFRLWCVHCCFCPPPRLTTMLAGFNDRIYLMWVQLPRDVLPLTPSQSLRCRSIYDGCPTKHTVCSHQRYSICPTHWYESQQDVAFRLHEIVSSFVLPVGDTVFKSPSVSNGAFFPRRVPSVSSVPHTRIVTDPS